MGQGGLSRRGKEGNYKLSGLDETGDVLAGLGTPTDATVLCHCAPDALPERPAGLYWDLQQGPLV